MFAEVDEMGEEKLYNLFVLFSRECAIVDGQKD